LGQAVLNFGDLPRRQVARENREDGSHRIARIDRPRVGKPLVDLGDERFEIAVGRLLRGLELIVVHAAHQERQLGAKMGRKLERQAVTQLMQHRPKALSTRVGG
jgi:hypothetical protein